MRSQRVFGTYLLCAVSVAYLSGCANSGERPVQYDSVTRVGSIQLTPTADADVLKVIADACLYRTAAGVVMLTLDPNCPGESYTNDPGTLLITLQPDADGIVLTGTDI